MRPESLKTPRPLPSFSHELADTQKTQPKEIDCKGIISTLHLNQVLSINCLYLGKKNGLLVILPNYHIVE